MPVRMHPLFTVLLHSSEEKERNNYTTGCTQLFLKEHTGASDWLPCHVEALACVVLFTCDVTHRLFYYLNQTLALFVCVLTPFYFMI